MMLTMKTSLLVMQSMVGTWLVGNDGDQYCQAFNYEPVAAGSGMQGKNFDVAMGIFLYPSGTLELRAPYTESHKLNQPDVKATGLRLKRDNGAQIAYHYIGASKKDLSNQKYVLIFSPMLSNSEALTVIVNSGSSSLSGGHPELTKARLDRQAMFLDQVVTADYLLIVDDAGKTLVTLDTPNMGRLVSSLKQCVAGLGSGEDYRDTIKPASEK